MVVIKILRNIVIEQMCGNSAAQKSTVGITHFLLIIWKHIDVEFFHIFSLMTSLQSIIYHRDSYDMYLVIQVVCFFNARCPLQGITFPCILGTINTDSSKDLTSLVGTIQVFGTIHMKERQNGMKSFSLCPLTNDNKWHRLNVRWPNSQFTLKDTRRNWNLYLQTTHCV